MEDIKLKDLIFVVKGALTKDQCELLIKEYDERSESAVKESCIHAVTNQMTTSTFKRVELIPDTDTFNIVHNKINSIIEGWIQHLNQFGAFHPPTLKKFLRFSHMHRLMKYEIGGWIHPHIDWEEMIHASCTIALNSEYEGGDFRFWNGRHIVKLEAGDAMIFPADPFWVHEVTEITKGARYSTNTFIQALPIAEREHVNKLIWDLGFVRNPLMYPHILGDNNEELVQKNYGN
jgi:predicted 2-oxoglutarate/Fe(II)-dependent dioxygenase YbiX